jgi:hypothetical protein
MKQNEYDQLFDRYQQLLDHAFAFGRLMVDRRDIRPETLEMWRDLNEEVKDLESYLFEASQEMEAAPL